MISRIPLTASVAALVILISLPAAPARADSVGVGSARKVGIGFILGEPTGLSGKYWLTHTDAVDFGAAWSFVHEASFQLHADYLFHDFSVFHPSEGRMPLYYGIGGRLRFSHASRLGVRGVLGLNYMFDTAPVDAFVELAPVLDIAPKTEFNLMGGIGVRFFFGPAWQ